MQLVGGVGGLKAIVEPDSVTDDIGRATVPFVGIHDQIIDSGELI